MNPKRLALLIVVVLLVAPTGASSRQFAASPEGTALRNTVHDQAVQDCIALGCMRVDKSSWVTIFGKNPTLAAGGKYAVAFALAANEQGFLWETIFKKTNGVWRPVISIRAALSPPRCRAVKGIPIDVLNSFRLNGTEACLA